CSYVHLAGNWSSPADGSSSTTANSRCEYPSYRGGRADTRFVAREPPVPAALVLQPLLLRRRVDADARPGLAGLGDHALRLPARRVRRGAVGSVAARAVRRGVR